MLCIKALGIITDPAHTGQLCVLENMTIVNSDYVGAFTLMIYN